jgi:regulator of protease activity HflC (stomatin/prohibitin superfamily)
MGGVGALIGCLIGLILIIISFGYKSKKLKEYSERFAEETRRRWKQSSPRDAFLIMVISGLSVLFLCLIAVGGLSFKIIDAGEVGVQVKFGRVMDKTLTEGFNSKSIFSVVYPYNIRIREYTMTSTVGEGKVDSPDAVSARTADNSEVQIDATLWWAVDPIKAQEIYKKVAQNDRSLEEIIIRPAFRTAIRDEASRFNLEELMKDRDLFGVGLHKETGNNVLGKGVIIDKVLVRKIDPPRSVDEAIQRKLKAEQELAQKQFELEKAHKDAEIRITQAHGVAEAQDIIQKKLTPIYVQYEAIQAYKDLAGSNNTTFVIMPTSTKGAGMPLILNTK